MSDVLVVWRVRNRSFLTPSKRASTLWSNQSKYLEHVGRYIDSVATLLLAVLIEVEFLAAKVRQ